MEVPGDEGLLESTTRAAVPSAVNRDGEMMGSFLVVVGSGDGERAVTLTRSTSAVATDTPTSSSSWISGTSTPSNTPSSTNTDRADTNTSNISTSDLPTFIAVVTVCSLIASFIIISSTLYFLRQRRDLKTRQKRLHWLDNNLEKDPESGRYSSSSSERSSLSERDSPETDLLPDRAPPPSRASIFSFPAFPLPPSSTAYSRLPTTTLFKPPFANNTPDPSRSLRPNLTTPSPDSDSDPLPPNSWLSLHSPVSLLTATESSTDSRNSLLNDPDRNDTTQNSRELSSKSQNEEKQEPQPATGKGKRPRRPRCRRAEDGEPWLFTTVAIWPWSRNASKTSQESSDKSVCTSSKGMSTGQGSDSGSGPTTDQRSGPAPGPGIRAGELAKPESSHRVSAWTAESRGSSQSRCSGVSTESTEFEVEGV